jgi:phospholipid/cholesterol/gamma-HCH transport system substrate-binding protein
MRFRIRFADKIVGVFILLAILGVAAALILLGMNQRWFARNYAFWSRFATAEGLTAGMPIKLKGFEIGKVDRLSLSWDNMVEMEFHIFDTYYAKILPGTVLEKASSPLGLGTGLLLHPGPGEGSPLPELSLIPSSDMEEGRRLLAVTRSTAPQSDPIAALLGQVQPVLEEIDRTVVSIRALTDTLNSELQGKGGGPLSSTLNEVASASRQANSVIAQTGSVIAQIEGVTRSLGVIAGNLEATSAALRDPTGLAKRLLDPKGSVATLLDDDNQLYARIQGSLEELNAVIAQLAAFTRFVNTTQPQILGLLEQGRATLDQGQDVLEAVKNNPLLRGGVPPKGSQPTPFQSYRDEEF